MMFPFLFGYSATEKAMIDQADYHSPYQWLFTTSFVAFVTVSVVYIVLAYQKINQYERVIGDNFGYNEGISLQWLRLLLIGFGLALPEGSPRWQLHLQSQHIKDTGIMLLLLCGVYQIMTLTLCLVKPLVNKLDVGVCRIQLPF